MKKWDRFVLNSESKIEDQLLKKYDAIKRTLSAATDKLYIDMGDVYEPLKEKVSFCALSRCGTCLESMLLLARNGYIGSANALLRQVYEFLIWAKLTIDANDKSVLMKLPYGYYVT